MLIKEQCMEILILHKQGFSNRKIAKMLQISRNTVKKYLQSVKDVPCYKARPLKETKLGPYHKYLEERLQFASPNRIPATVLLLELKEQGYPGGMTQLRDYLRTLRTQIKNDPIVRFETAPGEQMQVDWAEFKFGKTKLHAFIATLGFSRFSYVEFVENEKLETLIASHQNAFDFFQGVPRVVLYDNMKSIVIKRHAYGQGLHKFQEQFFDYAKHMGFLPRLCKPYRAKTKGKVERFIGYLRFSFFNPLASKFKQSELELDFVAANIAVIEWLDKTANVRIHADLKEQPVKLWCEIEKPQLQALPPRYSGLKQSESKETLYNSLPHSTLLPGYDTTFLQHPMAIYEQIQQLVT